MSTGPAPWELWWVHLTAGSEPRLVLLIASELACNTLPRLAIAPISSTDYQMPLHLPLTVDGESGFILCDQLRTIDRRNLIQRHPSYPQLTNTETTQVRRTLRHVLAA